MKGAPANEQILRAWLALLLCLLGSPITSARTSLQTLTETDGHLHLGVTARAAAYQNAYVSMIYCGTTRDYEYNVATRVFMKSLAKLKPEADLVVLASTTCPSPWLRTLDTDGVRVIPVSDIPNPYRDQSKFDPRFIHARNKLYAWSLLEYTCVVMLDADNMFLQNADELFTCGEFCAVFINPCVLHTGLVVLKVRPPSYMRIFPHRWVSFTGGCGHMSLVQPSNETYQSLRRAVGELSSRDGADQGLLHSYFSSLIKAPWFEPPPHGGPLAGPLYRLPFGYQMDTSYFYYRLKWHVLCGPNSILTFPGSPLLKPWFWWGWPMLPFGITWHQRRGEHIGYAHEIPSLLLQLLSYLTILLTAILWHHRRGGRENISRREGDKKAVRVCAPVARAVVVNTCGVLSLWLLAIFLPFFIILPIVHPLMGWELYFGGSLTLLISVALTLQLPMLPTFTPWMALMVSWCHMAAPIYNHGAPRVLMIGVVAFVLSPFLWWALRRLVEEVDEQVGKEYGKWSGSE